MRARRRRRWLVPVVAVAAAAVALGAWLLWPRPQASGDATTGQAQAPADPATWARRDRGDAAATAEDVGKVSVLDPETLEGPLGSAASSILLGSWRSWAKGALPEADYATAEVDTSTVTLDGGDVRTTLLVPVLSEGRQAEERVTAAYDGDSDTFSFQDLGV